MSSSKDSPNASAIPSSEMVDNMERYKLLYEACKKGDWDSVKRFVEDNPDPNLWTTGIDTYDEYPALCVGALSGQTKLIRNLVELMPGDALLATDHSFGYTALHYIAKNGDVEAAKILVTKNPLLTLFQNYSQETPLLLAARLGRKEMVKYLLKETKDEDFDRQPGPFRGEQGAALLASVINFDLYDVALHLVEKCDGIATTKDSEGMSTIRALARKAWPSAISRGQWFGYHCLTNSSSTISRTKQYKQYLKLTECICRKIRVLDESLKCDLLNGSVMEAFKHGGEDFIKLIIDTDSSQIKSLDQDEHSILYNAIKSKQKELFHYLKKSKFIKELLHEKDERSEDTILHLAAKISPPRVLNQVSGAALQIKHELKWYQEVAAMVPSYENTRNREGLTPEDIFYKEHQALIQEGGKWMQNIASSYMVVATLIATVVFAAAFTVPGGTRSDMGMPFFLNKRSYLVFAVSNAMALIFSLTSVLIFLSILTSTYVIEDLVSPPQRLRIGVAMLFFAIATMTTAFSATYFIMLGHKLAWLSILIAFFISLPVILFVILQADLFNIFKFMHMLYMSYKL